ncbi:MAG: hypothetical protein LC772_12715 [Chloroflexi bacterium]|nr:hypothetical protein [Chloroflexota bacterium]
MRAEFLIDRNGKSFCLYAGLLDEAHQQGLSEIRTTLIQIPTDLNGNVAICQCEVRTERGVFTGLGDASPQNVARAMLTCLIRMAETRAKARALRDAVNVGVAALEELDSEGSSGDQGEPAGVGRGAYRSTSISSSPGAAPVSARRDGADLPNTGPASAVSDSDGLRPGDSVSCAPTVSSLPPLPCAPLPVT